MAGFIKSLIFQLLPRLLKDLWKLECACFLVVTPLVSIMKDQVEDLTRLGLRAFAISLGDEKGEKTFNRISIFIAFIHSVHQSVMEWDKFKFTYHMSPKNCLTLHIFETEFTYVYFTQSLEFLRIRRGVPSIYLKRTKHDRTASRSTI